MAPRRMDEVMPKHRARRVRHHRGEPARRALSARRTAAQDGFETATSSASPDADRAQRGAGIDDSDSTWQQRGHAGGLLLVAAAAWAIWFFWWMLSGPGE
jgi:hypothetical protein